MLLLRLSFRKNGDDVVGKKEKPSLSYLHGGLTSFSSLCYLLSDEKSRLDGKFFKCRAVSLAPTVIVYGLCLNLQDISYTRVA